MKPAPLAWQPSDGSLVIVPDRRKHPCSRCGGPRNVPGQAYCRACHAAQMREFRAAAKDKARTDAAELAELRRLRHVQGNVSRATSEATT